MVCVCAVHTTVAAGAHATPPLALKAVPADVVAVYVSAGQEAGVPPPDGQSAVQLVASLSDQAYQLGLLSKIAPSVRGWIDALSSLPEVLVHPHAVALMKVSGRPREDGGHELATLEAVVIVTTRGANDGLERRIQHLLNVYTNTEQTVLSNRSHDGEVSFTIRDRRLPPWATVSWGRIGDHYVVALADGAYQRVTDAVAGRSPSLYDDAWLTQAIEHAGANYAALLFYADFARARRNADVLLAAKIEDVAQALALSGAERAVVAFSRAGRSVEAVAVMRRGDSDQTVPLVGRQFLAKGGESVIPQQARGYAVIDLNPSEVVQSAAQAYLTAKSPGSREHIRSFWRDVESSTGVRIEQDILQHLGGPMIIHDYPRHALGLPLAWTITLPVEGDANLLRKNLDTLLNTASRRLAGTSSVQLVRDPDGIWYVQMGLAGPAIVVSDRWVVVSFSPNAVRQNVQFLRAN